METECQTPNNVMGMFRLQARLARHLGRIWTAAGYQRSDARNSSYFSSKAIRYFSSKAKFKEPVKRPSLTWGVIQDEGAVKPGREEVLKYLEDEGIDTSEYENVELPTTIDIVKERLEFLLALGLTKENINAYPLMVCCSVKKNMMPVIEYLESLGVTRVTLPQVLRKYPMVLHSSVAIDLEPAVRFLQGLGIPRLSVCRVLLKYPDVLGFRLEGTMSTSIGYLVSCGLDIKVVAPIVLECPEILGMRVGNNIKPKLDYLIDLGIDKEAVAKIIEKHPYLLTRDLEEQIKPNVECIQKIGVRKEMLPAIITHFPDVLMISIGTNVFRKAAWFQQQLNISTQEFAQVIERLPQALLITEEVAMRRIDFLISFGGFRVEDCKSMVLACPHILIVDVDGMLKENLLYFTNEMKRPLQELVNFPAYFTYSLDRRIKPRFEQIKLKGITCSLTWLLNCSDAKFEERLSMGAQCSEIDELNFIMGGLVPVPTVTKEEGDICNSEDDDGEAVEMIF